MVREKALNLFQCLRAYDGGIVRLKRTAMIRVLIANEHASHTPVKVRTILVQE